VAILEQLFTGARNDYDTCSPSPESFGLTASFWHSSSYRV